MDEKPRSLDVFLKPIREQLAQIRPIDASNATQAVFRIQSRHANPGQIEKVKHALPGEVQAIWIKVTPDTQVEVERAITRVTMPRRAAGAPEGGPLACGTRGNRSPRPSRSGPCRRSDDPAADQATATGLMEVDMRVAEVMTRDVRLIEPNQTIRDAARLMAEMDAGIMPVRDGDRLVGMITDRDIAVRAVAQGRGPDTAVREVMTDEVKYCYEGDDTNDVARNMADIQVRRLPVLTREKRLVGIISLGDMAMSDGAAPAGEAVAGISQPGGQHSQTGGPRT
jgi:CBS domain-containing protein